jgi:aldehyde:ferredoxin oxidoreductase
MLGMRDAFKVLALIDAVDKQGLDVMSAGVALAWATEALEKGILSENETLVPLKFGDEQTYRQAMQYLATGANEFYRLLGQGTMKAAAYYGGTEFACVLGQEMAGYATGEVFFVSQALGLRHSHLDSSGYSYDQKHTEKNVGAAIDFLIRDERERVLLTSMVACLFARGVYSEAILGECLRSVGYTTLAENIGPVSTSIQKLRWKTRLATGFDPRAVTIPKRFTEITTWKGKVDEGYLIALMEEYARRILEMGKDDMT